MKNTYYNDHINNEKLNAYDYILFIIVFVCPYLDNGIWTFITSFFPLLNSVGSQFLAFCLSLILFQYSVRNNYGQKTKGLYFLVLIASIWTFTKLIQTFEKTEIEEAIVVYRRNFILLPTFLFCMRYISNLSIEKIEALFKLSIKWIIATSVIYFIQCFGIEIFLKELSTQTVEGYTVIRSILGMPITVPAFLSLFFISYIFGINRKSLVYLSLCVIIVVLSYTRNLMATMAFVMALSIFFYISKYGLRKRIGKIFIKKAFLLVVFSLLFPNIFLFWINLIEDTIKTQLTEGQGTYNFRLTLIEQALSMNKEEGNILTGAGYIRDSIKGEYSFVLGTDTYIAPVLRCEGYIGLFLRCLPCLYLLMNSFKIYFYKKSNKIRSILALTIIVSILSAIPNYVQTEIFVRYNYIMSALYIMYIYILKYREVDVCKQIQ